MPPRTPDEIYNQRLILGLTTVLIILCYGLYFLRILSRKTLQTSLWLDDWCMFCALVICSAMSIENYLGLAFGSGVHRDHLEEWQYRSFQINLYVFMMSWALGVALVKIGILLFYYRVFIAHEFRRRVAIVGAIIIASNITNFLGLVLQCLPVPRFWGDTQEGYCINQRAFWLSSGSINIAGDVLCLTLPLWQVWKLKASVNQRAALVFLFGLGGFVCITSIIRLVALNEIKIEDFSYTNVGGGLWSTVEVQVGFICANLPHTRSLMRQWLERWTQRSGHSYSGWSHPRGDSRQHIRNVESRPWRDTGGFESLESQREPPTMAGGLSVGRDVEKGNSNQRSHSTNTYDSDQALSTSKAPFEVGEGRVEVQTEVRQEVERVQSPLSFCADRPQGWLRENEVLTEISAKRADQ